MQAVRGQGTHMQDNTMRGEMLTKISDNALQMLLCEQGWPEPFIHTVYIRYFKQINHHTYGRIRCVHTVLANPICEGGG